MPSRTLPGIGLQGFWNSGEAWKQGGDLNWLAISALTQLVVESATAALPSSPPDGVIYIVPHSDTTNPDKIAVRDNGAWVYFPPKAGWKAFVKDAVTTLRYSGLGWVEDSAGGVPEAPSDGKTYGRKDEGWVEITGGGGGGGIPEAPADGRVYGRSNEAWTQAQRAIEFQDEGGAFTRGNVDTVNFQGAGVSATLEGTTLIVDIPGGGSGGKLSDLSDVYVENPIDGQGLRWNDNLKTWEQSIDATLRNGFIDGNFDFWSVGTSFALPSDTDVYTADMWIANAGTGGAATVSRDVRSPGSEIVGMARPSKFRVKFDQTTAASSNPLFGQKIEGVRSYNGQTVTFSCYLQTEASTTVLISGARVTQNFGTGGSADVVTEVNVSDPWYIDTTEKRFGIKIDIPSIAGKTIGPNNDDYLRIDLRINGGIFTIYIDQMQIEWCDPNADVVGAPSPFEYRGIAAEKVRVQRHVRKLFDTDAIGVTDLFVGYASSATAAVGVMQLGTPMRKIPNLVFTKGSANGLWVFPGAAQGSSVTVGNPSPELDRFRLTVNVSGGLTANAPVIVRTDSLPACAAVLDARL
jgi:hypothetical protein